MSTLPILSDPLPEPIANTAKQRVHTTHPIQGPDEIVTSILAILDPKHDLLIGPDGFNPEKAGGEPFDDLSSEAGGLFGAARMNMWSREQLFEYLTLRVGGRLPQDIILRAIQRHDAVLSFVNNRPLPGFLANVEIYGQSYQVSDGKPEISIVELSDGWGDLQGLFGLWPVVEDSRSQWYKIMSTLKRRGVEQIRVICLNLPQSHALVEAGFVEAVMSHFPNAEPLAVTQGMYVD